MNTHAAVAAVSLALGLAGGWTARDWKASADRAERAEVAAESERLARRVIEKRAEGARRATDAYMAQARRARADTAAARGDLGRLRDAIAATTDRAERAEAACRADGERTALLGRLLAESAGLAEEGLERTAELAGRLGGLQEWVTRVCLSEGQR